MARTGPPVMSAQLSLTGAKQTLPGQPNSVAIDPKMTLGTLNAPPLIRYDAPVLNLGGRQ
jgi:hypothetical protein